jgi:acetylornithine deacetylase/succinyl-diaminopimelate desuccinylase-like protein
MWPGIPVVPTMSAGATDGRFLNNAGIWTYGVTGLFSGPGGSNAHGLNERLPVKSLYEGHEFNYRLIKRLATP